MIRNVMLLQPLFEHPASVEHVLQLPLQPIGDVFFLYLHLLLHKHLFTAQTFHTCAKLPYLTLQVGFLIL